MATTRVDPYRAFQFLVEIDGITQAGFQECGGLDSSTDNIDYREGPDPAHVRKLTGLNKFSPITLKRGITDSDELFKWRQTVLDGKPDRKNGSIVLLEEQDRSLWNGAQIAEGLALVERALRRTGQLSAYAVQAAIAALHARAADKDRTDWPQIVGLYEVLLRLQPTPVIELNHAVAVSMVDGAGKALDLVDSLSARGSFRDYHLLHAARAYLLQKLGRQAEALDAYRTALASARLEPERRLIARRIQECEGAVS